MAICSSDVVTPICSGESTRGQHKVISCPYFLIYETGTLYDDRYVDSISKKVGQ